MRPKKYEYIIGANSLWLIIPIIYNQFKGINLETALVINTLICMSVSTIMWHNYDNKTILYKLDLFFATIQFMLLNLTNIFYPKLNYTSQILLSCLILLSYFVTNVFYKKEQWLYNTCFHLTFRYFGYIFAI